MIDTVVLYIRGAYPDPATRAEVISEALAAFEAQWADEMEKLEGASRAASPEPEKPEPPPPPPMEPLKVFGDDGSVDADGVDARFIMLEPIQREKYDLLEKNLKAWF